MPDYVLFMKLTARGAEVIDTAPDRMAAATKMWAEFGGEMTSFHATFGEYDFVAVGSAPNDWAAAAFSAALAANGFVTTTTARAFTQDDVRFFVSGDASDVREGNMAVKIPNVTKHNFSATFFGPPLGQRPEV